MDISHPRISYGASQIQPLRGSGLFARMHLVEQVGSGINRMNDLMKTADLPLPEFSTDGMFTIKFNRPSSKSDKPGDKLGDKLGDKVDSRNKIINCIISNNDITITELATMLGITYKGVQYHIAAMQKAGILKREGSRKSGYWKVLK
jgi:ATP-dependent DNA helicase RecG